MTNTVMPVTVMPVTVTEYAAQPTVPNRTQVHCAGPLETF